MKQKKTRKGLKRVPFRVSLFFWFVSFLLLNRKCIKFFHFGNLQLIHDFNIRLHSFIIRVAGEQLVRGLKLLSAQGYSRLGILPYFPRNAG